GLFIWQTATFVDALRGFNHELHDFYIKLRETGFQREKAIEQFLRRIYPTLSSISIDHAILEKVDRIYFVPASFGWHDIGSWAALSECFETDADGNFLKGDIIA